MFGAALGEFPDRRCAHCTRRRHGRDTSLSMTMRFHMLIATLVACAMDPLPPPTCTLHGFEAPPEPPNSGTPPTIASRATKPGLFVPAAIGERQPPASLGRHHERVASSSHKCTPQHSPHHNRRTTRLLLHHLDLLRMHRVRLAMPPALILC